MKTEHSLIKAPGEFFEGLPSDLQQALSDAALSRTYPDGATIHRRGDVSPGLTIVQAGSVRLSNIGRDGREVVLTTVMPGEAYGEFTLFADLPRQYDSVARGETVIDAVSRESFEALLVEQPNLGNHVIRHLARRLYQALELLDDERRLPLVARLGKLLLRLPPHPENRTVIEATQQDLANELAVSRVALSSALRYLTGKEFIETGYRCIHLRKRKLLEDWVSTHTQLSPATALK